MTNSPKRLVTIAESGDGPYAQHVTIGHHVMRADEGEAAGGQRPRTIPL